MTPAGSCLLLTASRTSRNHRHIHPSYVSVKRAAYKNIFRVIFSCNPEKMEVVLGRTFRKQNSSSEQIFKVEKYWIHEKFDNESFDNDIGE